MFQKKGVAFIFCVSCARLDDLEISPSCNSSLSCMLGRWFSSFLVCEFGIETMWGVRVSLAADVMKVETELQHSSPKPHSYPTLRNNCRIDFGNQVGRPIHTFPPNNHCEDHCSVGKAERWSTMRIMFAKPTEGSISSFLAEICPHELRHYSFYDIESHIWQRLDLW